MKQNRTNTTDTGSLPAGSRPLSLDACRAALASVEQTRRTMFEEHAPALAPREHLLRLALNEAEALAWQTDFPHLFFPELAVEKVRAVSAWHAQQQARQRHQPVLRLAA